ncbi:MAG: hypothetical protein Q9162_006099 [Coniocarpon cinnabarinum]
MNMLASQPILQGLAGVGALYLGFKLVSFVRLIFSVFLLPGTSLSTFGPKGSWAVITGASDGIGAEFARQLARNGFNLVLVSRTASKLDALSQEIKTSNSGIETKLLAMDFAQNQSSDYDSLRSLTRDLDVSILINNVGVSHSIPVPFVETSQTELNSIVSVNVLGTLQVTQLLAPGMIERKRGLILTMASFGGIVPTPLLATYSGSKAFLQQWSTALGSELVPKGVTVDLMQSYLVTSAMSKIRRTSMFIPNPRSFVKSALSKVGRSGGAQGIAYTTSPYWSHAILQWAIMTFVGTMSKVAVDQNGRTHADIRKRALRKAEREAKKQ